MTDPAHYIRRTHALCAACDKSLLEHVDADHDPIFGQWHTLCAVCFLEDRRHHRRIGTDRTRRLCVRCRYWQRKAGIDWCEGREEDRHEQNEDPERLARLEANEYERTGHTPRERMAEVWDRPPPSIGERRLQAVALAIKYQLAGRPLSMGEIAFLVGCSKERVKQYLLRAVGAPVA